MKLNIKYFFIIVFALILARPAYAYLDPGTGSMLLQILAAGALAIGVGWRSFVRFIRGKNKKNKVDEELKDELCSSAIEENKKNKVDEELKSDVED